MQTNQPVDATLARNFGLSGEEFDRVLAIMGRTPSLTEAAEILGIDQATLYRKRKKIGLQ